MGEPDDVRPYIRENIEKKEGNMRVWWTRNMPNEMEYYQVKNLEEGIKVIKELIKEDLKNKFVTDNAGGLEIYEDDDWCEFYDDNGNDVMQIIDGEDEIKRRNIA